MSAYHKDPEFAVRLWPDFARPPHLPGGEWLTLGIVALGILYLIHRMMNP